MPSHAAITYSVVQHEHSRFIINTIYRNPVSDLMKRKPNNRTEEGSTLAKGETFTANFICYITLMIKADTTNEISINFHQEFESHSSNKKMFGKTANWHFGCSALWIIEAWVELIKFFRFYSSAEMFTKPPPPLALQPAFQLLFHALDKSIFLPHHGSIWMESSPRNLCFEMKNKASV